MADLLECDDAVEQEGRGRERWVDPGAKVFFDEVVGIIADRLGRQDAPEGEMWELLDGVPASVVLEACDRLGVVVRRGVWRVGRRA